MICNHYNYIHLLYLLSISVKTIKNINTIKNITIIIKLFYFVRNYIKDEILKMTD